MPQLIFYCHEFIVKLIFYALCFLFIFFKAFAWMDVQSDFTHMQDIDGKKKTFIDFGISTIDISKSSSTNGIVSS